jgi:8-oxo-dGTP diphosphatase
MKIKYCNQCGHSLEFRYIEDRTRQVCSNCNAISYQNPLPVAAVVLLNRNRDVLLVKRKNQPRHGKWCLPMGFVEVDETIAQSALRELEEETGIRGKIIRLVAIRSEPVETYGDLLIVTFEAEKIGGSEIPGSDADDMSYYPANYLPEMAFESNKIAIRYCFEGHKEEWAINDSFKIFEEQKKSEMLSDSMVAFIRDNAKEVSERWLKIVLSDKSTVSYSRADPEKLRERVASALSQFTRWLSGSEADTEVRAFFRKLGSDRKLEGFELHEVISSLTLLRKVVLIYARNHKVWGKTIDLYTLIELDHRNYIFFDKAIYHLTRGFLED